KDYADIQSEIAQTDVMIVATGAQQPTISKELLYLKRPLLILDLSIPKNVSDDVSENDLVTLVHLDDLSAVTEQTLEQRTAQLPKGREMIGEIDTRLIQGTEDRKFAPTIKALKVNLAEIQAGEIDSHRQQHNDFNEQQAEIISDRILQKITTH